MTQKIKPTDADAMQTELNRLTILCDKFVLLNDLTMQEFDNVEKRFQSLRSKGDCTGDLVVSMSLEVIKLGKMQAALIRTLDLDMKEDEEIISKEIKRMLAECETNCTCGNRDTPDKEKKEEKKEEKKG